MVGLSSVDIGIRSKECKARQRQRAQMESLRCGASSFVYKMYDTISSIETVTTICEMVDMLIGMNDEGGDGSVQGPEPGRSKCQSIPS